MAAGAKLEQPDEGMVFATFAVLPRTETPDGKKQHRTT